MIYPLLILLVNLIYLPAIKYEVINDDATELKLYPYNVRRAKVVSIILHLMTAEFIYLAFGSSQVSFIAALLFSVHPLAIQVPVWKAGSAYGVNALIFLLIKAFAPFSAPLYIVGMLSTATTLFTPLLFLFTGHWYIALMFPLLALISYKKIWKENVEVKKKGNELFSTLTDFKLSKFAFINLVIVVKTFGYYALACLLPMKNGFYNSFLATLGASHKDTKYWYSFNRHFWGGLFAMILMAVVWWFNKFNFVGMGILLFVLSIGPFLNFITVQQFTAPRYAYLPLIGFQIALVSLIFRLPAVWQAGICGALFIFYLDRTLRVMKHYAKDNITMMELDSQVFPDNPRLWYYRYEHMLHKNNPIMAWAEATYGLKHLPEDCQLWFGLAVASFELGDMNAAGEFLKTSERFMILSDRKNMQSLIAEMRERIRVKLAEKYSPKRRF